MEEDLLGDPCDETTRSPGQQKEQKNELLYYLQGGSILDPPPNRVPGGL
jgi:hypothetical protein